MAMTNLHIIAKGGLIILILISLAILIERLTNTRSFVEIFDRDAIVLEASTTTSPVIDIELKNIEKCLIEYSKSPRFILRNMKNTSCPLKSGQCMLLQLIDFNEHMESFHIKPLLIEPSLLFCLLPSSRKFNLLTRGFDNAKVQGPGNVLTFYINPSEADVLDQTRVRLKLVSDGYRISRYSKWINSDFVTGEKSDTKIKSRHFFITVQDLVIHLVTFYPRGKYLWLPYLNSTDINVESLQYVNDSACEKFTVSTMPLSALSSSQVYLPSDSRYFLLDTMSSNFLECKEELIYSALPYDTNSQKALNELKVVLSSQMVIFWLWSKSLQGWLEQCNVFHYTPVLNIALSAKSVEGFNFTALFTNSECQHIENYSNLDTIVKIDLNCHGLPVNLFLMYDDKNIYWYEHFDGHNTYKLSFPKFTLCSTDVFGMKINIPCETSEILESEYGQFLRNTTLYLNPKEMKNVVLETST